MNKIIIILGSIRIQEKNINSKANKGKGTVKSVRSMLERAVKEPQNVKAVKFFYGKGDLLEAKRLEKSQFPLPA